MALRSTDDRYGTVAIALHWAGALSVLMMLLTAALVWLAPDRAVAVSRLQLHGSFGILLYAVIVARIVWHFIDRQPSQLQDRPALHALAKVVQLGMLVLIAAQLLTGPLDVWSGGWPIDVFDWFAIPSPFASVLKTWHDPIGVVHRYTGYLIATLVAIHIAAAFKHLLIDRDRTVQRMLGQPAPVPAARTTDEAF